MSGPLLADLTLAVTRHDGTIVFAARAVPGAIPPALTARKRTALLR